MDGEEANASEFQDRLDSLNAIGDPIFFRYDGLSLLQIFLYKLGYQKLF